MAPKNVWLLKDDEILRLRDNGIQLNPKILNLQNLTEIVPKVLGSTPEAEILTFEQPDPGMERS